MSSVASLIHQLEQQAVSQLRQTYTATTGEPARSNNREWLIKRIAWASQAAARGGLSERARARAASIARDQDLRVRVPQAIHDAVAAVNAPTLRLSPAGTDEPNPPTAVNSASRQLPPTGSILVREYRGRRLEVQVLERGFVFEGREFRSLSGIAKHVTGQPWSGAVSSGFVNGANPMKHRSNHSSHPPAPPLKRIAVYCRVSSDEGMTQQFTSIDAQRAAGEAFIASRVSEGWELIPQRFDDPGFSGASLERPAVQRLLDLVAKGEVDGIVVRALDRLSRSLRDVCKVNELLSANDVFLASVTQSLDTGTPHGRLMLNMIVSFAECEREVTVERTKAKIAATRRQGIWRGGRPLLGYDHGPEGLVVNTAEASAVRGVFSRYLEARSLNAVVAQLRLKGTTNKGWTSRDGRVLGGQPFSQSTLSLMLSNPLYCGLVPHNGATYPGKHAAIIAPEVFQRVQQMLATNNRSGTGVAGAQHRHAPGLLKGLLVCGCCGRPMQYTTAKGDREIVYRYVRCVTASCPTKAVPAGEIEGFVLSKVRGTFADAGLVTKVLDLVRARANERVLDLDAQRELLHDELKDAESLLTNADESIRTEAASRHAQASSTLAFVEKAFAEARAALVDRATVERGLREFDSLFACLSPTERSQLIASVVERITFDSAKGEIAICMRSHGNEAPKHSTQEDAA